MAEVIKTTFQLRRGNAAVWAKNNPVLSRGEPGFIIDENRLKIGDGVTAWNDLPYIGEDNVINALTHYIYFINIYYRNFKTSQQRNTIIIPTTYY